MATFINKRINNTTNTKEDTSMENKIMYIQQTNSIATMLPGGGMHGGEQTDILPGGGFHNECTEELPGGGMDGGEQTDIIPGGGFHNECTEELPGGGMHGGEQTDILPGGGFHNECTEELPGGGMHGGEQTDILPSCEIHVDLNASQETSDGVKTDEEPPWMTGGEFGVDWFFA